MTSPTPPPTPPMSHEELMELAALDAFGLLDRYEAALYNRSFHHASAAVQDEIRQMQADLASDELLLPDVEPEAALRERVLKAVAKAIEADAERLAPLASIGPVRGRSRQVVSRLGLSLSGQFWRAAAFVLAGALLVVMYFNIQQRAEHNKVLDYAIGQITYEQVASLMGDDLLDFVRNKDCTALQLRPAAGQSPSMHAVLFINEKTGEGFLYGFDLPQRVQCSLHATRTDDGAEAFSHSFKSASIFGGVRLSDVSIALASNVTWQITDATSGAVLLTSA